MAGQIWSEPTRGGYMYADELSNIMRVSLQPLCKFRQFANVDDATDKGLHAGEEYTWNVYSDVSTQGRRLQEQVPIPETGFTITPTKLTVFEAGNSVPYTGKLEALSKQALVSMIDKTLKNDARKYFDIEVFLAFNATLLRVAPTGGNATGSLTISTNGTTGVTNNVPLGADHIKVLGDEMRERNIPPFVDDDYIGLSHPTTFRPLKNDLESIFQYTGEGMARIFAGEIGRYEGFRFVVQTQIPKGGAANSTTFDPYGKVADPWDNGQSSWAFFFGGDTVTEAVCIPEEIRAKLPGDYGRSKGIAWYYLGGFGLVHANDNTQSRILKWDSAA